MNPLQSRLAARVAEVPVPAAEVMALALYDAEHGYYRRAEGPWGFEGKDYYTALDLGPLLGQTLALRLDPSCRRALRLKGRREADRGSPAGPGFASP